MQSQIAELQERIDRDSRSNEVAQAISVLITAQQTADKTVAQADGYSAKVMAEARDLYEDTRKNAATLEQETEDKARARLRGGAEPGGGDRARGRPIGWRG